MPMQIKIRLAIRASIISDQRSDNGADYVAMPRFIDVHTFTRDSLAVVAHWRNTLGSTSLGTAPPPEPSIAEEYVVLLPA